MMLASVCRINGGRFSSSWRSCCCRFILSPTTTSSSRSSSASSHYSSSSFSTACTLAPLQTVPQQQQRHYSTEQSSLAKTATSSYESSTDESSSSTHLSVPSNLVFSPRSTYSPLYRLKRIADTRPTSAAAMQEEEEDEDEYNDQDEDDLNEYSDDEDNSDDEEAAVREVLYDLSTRPEPRVVIPLPDRLFVPVLDKSTGQEVGSLPLSERLFGHDEIRVDLLARTVQYQRNQKRGKRGAVTKTISQVRGSGRKVRPQKGTGQARAGHSRPAHWRGGAKAHGPKGQIQDYGNCKLNKQTRKLALTHALSQKVKEGNFLLLQDLNVGTHKTRELTALLKQWQIGGRNGRTAYIVDHLSADKEEAFRGVPINLSVAAQNIHNIKVDNQIRINVYDVLKHEKLVMTVEAVTALEARLEGLLRY